MKPHRLPITLHADHAGFLMVLCATVLLSSKAIVIKLAYQTGASPDILIALRMLMSLPFYLYFAIRALRSRQQPVSGKALAATAVVGICGYYFASVFDLYGLQYISASLERLILYSYPTLVILLAALLMNTPVTGRRVAAILTVYLGLFVVFSTSHQQAESHPVAIFGSEVPSLYLGSGLVFASALMFALFMLGSEQLMKVIPSRLFTAVGMLAATAAILVHFLLRNPIAELARQAVETYQLALVLAVFCTVLPSFLLSAGIQQIGATVSGAVGSLGPVFTVILAYALLDESLSSAQLLGFIIVIAGILLLRNKKP